MQEQGNGSSVIADHLTSLGIDEVFTRTEGSTTKTLLRDALGSTLAMADGTGIVTSWTYDPYGKATFTGVAQSNPFLYTGRELDGTGLYYYRARYYHPTLSRFIAEDPIEYAGGANIYGYVDGNPVSYRDPLGLFPGIGEGGDGFGGPTCGDPPKCKPPLGVKGWARIAWLAGCLALNRRPPPEPPPPPPRAPQTRPINSPDPSPPPTGVDPF